ncbi:hypothetical protein Glove_137g29 [Diversispora epigaea]|uniref:DNA mismatch repair protein PMS1 n=1 Tax=Diversispora epigaea TaxID=1348612 RepID=A0A397IWA4_9GLOM|nr:hypothetical protein Glove_137g29 [Diversispora epigaea]
MSIVKPIDASSVHKICSGQVILDLATAVKELVENSLDAQAKSIEIKFKEYGLHSIEVIDDGTGINKSNYEQLALKHYTSKLTNFEDLIKIDSFGFRGEALSSLCALSKVTVITSTKEEVPTGNKLEYNFNGQLIKTTSVARERGTTIILQNLFESVPVRYRDFKKNVKREFGKTLTLLQAYAVICKNVKIICTNQLNNGAKTTAFSTNCNNTIRENISNLFGAKSMSQTIPLDFILKINPKKQMISEDLEHQFLSDECSIHVIGYISKPLKSYGRGSADRQYYFINGRPCNLPKIAKVMNEIYKSFNTNQYPFLIADFQLAKFSYDVNVSPDKRTIFIHNENKIIEALKVEMNCVLEPFRSTFESHNTEVIKLSTEEISENSENAENSLCHVNTNHIEKGQQNRGENKKIRDDAAEYTENIKNYKTSKINENTGPVYCTLSEGNFISDCAKPGSSGKSKTFDSARLPSSIPLKRKLSRENTDKFAESISLLDEIEKISDTVHENHEKHKNENLIDVNEHPYNEILSKHYNNYSDDYSLITDKDLLSPPKDDICSLDRPNEQNENELKKLKTFNINETQIELPFDITRYDANKSENKLKTYMENKNDNDNINNKAHLHDLAGINMMDNKVAEVELNKVITKKDFGNMEIIGQFNLGFIIVKLNNDKSNKSNGDLFLIDQHAADEKYNFENLQLYTKIESQRLISPRRLELTAAEEMVAIENIKILQANGFELEIDHDAKSTNKLKLLSQPVSKNTIFGVKDLEELIFLLTDRPGEMVRCSHIRNMFASRACRKSVMIGDALDQQKMEKIVKHMGEINHPWNCPHGRPTMRHLFDLSQISVFHPYSTRQRNYQGSLFINKR